MYHHIRLLEAYTEVPYYCTNISVIGAAQFVIKMNRHLRSIILKRENSGINLLNKIFSH